MSYTMFFFFVIVVVVFVFAFRRRLIFSARRMRAPIVSNRERIKKKKRKRRTVEVEVEAPRSSCTLYLHIRITDIVCLSCIYVYVSLTPSIPVMGDGIRLLLCNWTSMYVMYCEFRWTNHSNEATLNVLIFLNKRAHRKQRKIMFLLLYPHLKNIIWTPVSI